MTQLTLILFVGGKYDLLFGFNRLDGGFTLLLSLFVLVPLLNLSWIITEIIFSVKLFHRRKRTLALLFPLVAVFFFIESLAIDLYLMSHAQM